MIIIDEPVLHETNEAVVISSSFKIGGETNLLWYKVPITFKEQLITERLDGFLVGLLFLGLKTGNDIQINGAISERLYYTLSHYLINALCLANPNFRKIEIFAEKLDAKDYNKGNCAGTGLSCGVDSFATYYDHLGEESPYQIDYFTFFNVGSHGDFGGERAREVFYDRFEGVKQVADKMNKEVITVDSNLSEVLRMNFLETNTLRNISCVLILQKLFRNYYVASKSRFDHYKLHAYNNQDFDLLTLNMLSTESTTFFSAVSHLTRVERTALISEYNSPKKYLNICTNPNHSIKSKNCSSCDKCLRTAFTLDLLNKLDLFQEVFDLGIYEENKNYYIGKILATKNEDQFSQEIFQLMKETNNNPYKNWYFYSKHQMKNLKKSLKQKLKAKLK